MRRLIIILIASYLVLSNTTFSQSQRVIKKNRSPRLAPIRSEPQLSSQMRRQIQLQQSKLRNVHSQATIMARKDLNPQADYEGEVITALDVIGRQADMLNRSSFENSDIDTLVQLVMFDAWVSEEEHLKDLIEEMQKMNRIKQKQRELLASLKKQKETVKRSLIDAINEAPRDKRPVKRVIVYRDVDLISGPGSRTDVVFVTDAQESTIEVNWGSNSRNINASLMLSGPGKTGYYQKKDGKGDLKIIQELTSGIIKRRRLWQVSLLIPKTSQYRRIKGRLTLTYMAHYSPDTQRISDKKRNALRQTQNQVENRMAEFFKELANIQKGSPKQSHDFAIRESIRYVNRMSNLFNTINQATESQAQGLYNLYDALANNLDSICDLSDMTSLRLQMTMDRRSKFISTLSQMMKKISTTEDILVQNIK